MSWLSVIESRRTCFRFPWCACHLVTYSAQNICACLVFTGGKPWSGAFYNLSYIFKVSLVLDAHEYYVLSCDQAALRTLISIRLSVCLSVRPSVRLSQLFDNAPVIVSSRKFQELLPLTDVISMQKVKVRDQKSRSQRSWDQFSRFETVTRVWIHIWWWNDAKSLMLLKRGALLFF